MDDRIRNSKIQNPKSTVGVVRRLSSVVLPRAWNLALDIVYPPRCGGCDRRGVLFCDDCRALVQCPDEAALQLNQLNLLVCAGLFRGPLRQAIHRFKYDSDKPLAVPLSDLQAHALYESERFAALYEEPPVLMPVPLHPARVRARGYNQAELLARKLAERHGWRLEQSLARVRNTRTQVGLSVDKREENVAGAFEWRGGDAPPFVLLVDDVCTTGATLSECAATLRAKGVLRVCAVTVAKAADDR